MKRKDPKGKDPVFGIEALQKLKARCEQHEKRKPLAHRGRRRPRKFGLSEEVKEYLKYIYDPE